jgi:hypothetical protein
MAQQESEPPSSPHNDRQTGAECYRYEQTLHPFMLAAEPIQLSWCSGKSAQ